ncbi:MAG: hypothetical protein WCE62_03690, partial [Polyangiales bacterium]
MKSVGAAVRIVHGRYSAALVLVDGIQVIEQVALPAPTESESVRFFELFQRTRDFVTEAQPDLFALKVFEGLAGKDEARRAEGVMLAGAGSDSSIKVSLLVGAGMWVPAGRPQPRRNPVIVGALCEMLDRELIGEVVRDAGAAALASVLKSS